MFKIHYSVERCHYQTLRDSATFKYGVVWKFRIFFFFTEEAVIDWTPQKKDQKYELKHTKIARVSITIKKAYPKPTYRL